MSEHNLPSPFTQLWCYLLKKEYETPARQTATDNRIDIPRLLLFVGFHLACVAVFWVGVSGVALLFAALFYVVRMFFITAFYHRYFSHKTYSVSRGIQFLMAVGCCSTGQRGPLWWAAHSPRSSPDLRHRKGPACTEERFSEQSYVLVFAQESHTRQYSTHQGSDTFPGTRLAGAVECSPFNNLYRPLLCTRSYAE